MRDKPVGEVVGMNRVQTVESLQMKLKRENGCRFYRIEKPKPPTSRLHTHGNFSEIPKLLKNIIYQIKK